MRGLGHDARQVRDDGVGQRGLQELPSVLHAALVDVVPPQEAGVVVREGLLSLQRGDGLRRRGDPFHREVIDPELRRVDIHEREGVELDLGVGAAEGRCDLHPLIAVGEGGGGGESPDVGVPLVSVERQGGAPIDSALDPGRRLVGGVGLHG